MYAAGVPTGLKKGTSGIKFKCSPPNKKNILDEMNINKTCEIQLVSNPHSNDDDSNRCGADSAGVSAGRF
jgi:hypothetical protein